MPEVPEKSVEAARMQAIEARLRLSIERIPNHVKRASWALVALGLLPLPFTLAANAGGLPAFLVFGFAILVALVMAQGNLSTLRWGGPRDEGGMKGLRGAQIGLIVLVVVNVVATQGLARVTDPVDYNLAFAVLQAALPILLAFVALGVVPRRVHACLWTSIPFAFLAAALGTFLFLAGMVSAERADQLTQWGLGLNKLPLAVAGLLWLARPEVGPRSLAGRLLAARPLR